VLKLSLDRKYGPKRHRRERERAREIERERVSERTVYRRRTVDLPVTEQYTEELK
jgi:hypothetical protein